MENKNVGWIIIGIAVLMIIVIFLFNGALKDIVAVSCGETHGDSCPMYDTITKQTFLALGIVGLLIMVALILIFSKPDEKKIIKTRTIKKKKNKIDTSRYRKEDKEVLKMIREKGTIFQAELIEKTNFGKAKMTRIIDRLEGKEIVERKRRGMTNVIVLKEN